ncbi:hypothetical protein M8C21_015936 [Ambrosia artemisiifolia]|uniref:Uncharacterized protein n=1 Tax=Ambrosia artemisiifolia TaxID=4212 RepID=A0AAD5GL34_AMBAR|nr:hypothetical protein M8C21_015936 [Ambrosia artemisiifolia]
MDIVMLSLNLITPKSAHSAVETRFIRFEDRVCEIQYKIIPNQGGHNNMGRPPYGRGGFKTEDSWHRDGEGRGNGNWGNKHIDYENFGQHSGQAREFNQRRNHHFQAR